MKSFDKWFVEASQNKLFWESPSKAAKMGFNAGQQSKQSEVDELKRELLNRTNEAYADGQRSMRKMIKSNEDDLRKRIDEISNHVEINYDENRDDDSHSYWSGYNQALRELFEILKGDQP